MSAPTSPAPAPRAAVAVALFALYVIWGSTYLALRFALEGFPPFLLAGVRFLVAGTGLYAVLRLRGSPAPTRAGWGAAALTGVLLLGVGNGGVTFAQQWVDSGVAALVVGSMPMWAALFGGLMQKTWPTPPEWAGLVLGFVGLVLLRAGGELSAKHPWAVAGLLLAPLCWALGSVWARRLPLPQGFMATAAQMLCGGALLLGLGLARGETLSAAPPARAVGAFVYLVVFGSLVAFSAYGFLLRNARPAVATSYGYVNPGVAVVLGVVFADEKLAPSAVVALGAITAAVVLITLKPRVRLKPRP